MKVYLSGPISGLSYEEATKWRLFVTDVLNAFDIKTLDPMRGKEVLAGCALLNAETVIDHGIAPFDIFQRDYCDVYECDVMLVNLTQRIDSIGTIMEIGWAEAMNKTIVLVTTEALFEKLHPFIVLSCDKIVYDMRDAVKYIVNAM